MTANLTIDRIHELLGDDGAALLEYEAVLSKDRLYLPSSDFVDTVYTQTDRPNRVLVNLARLFGHGRLGGTGYISILPVDQGIEHSLGVLEHCPAPRGVFQGLGQDSVVRKVIVLVANQDECGCSRVIVNTQPRSPFPMRANSSWVSRRMCWLRHLSYPGTGGLGCGLGW